MTKIPVPVRASSVVGSATATRHYGVYHASVVSNADPLGANRVTMQVPQVLGTATSNWAIPIGMTGVTPVKGQSVTAMFVGGDVNKPSYSISNAGLSDVVNVRTPPFSATGNGVNDDTAAINAALASAKPGSMVYLPDGTYLVSGPLSLPSGVELAGSFGTKHVQNGSIVKMASNFSGTGLIVFPSGSSEQRISRMCFDASGAPAGTAHCIDASTNSAQYVQLFEVHIQGAGFINGVIQNGTANGWRSYGVVVGSTNATGFNLNAPDCHWQTCQAIGCGTHGWSAQGCQNGKFVDCRADFNGDFGFVVQGAWTSGQGSGGCQYIGISTDRNVTHGVLITATGNSPMLFTNLSTRRDGSAGGGTGLRISSATVPIIIAGYECYPGVNDDGTGTASPATGISIIGTNTYISITNALVHAITTPISGTITNFRAVATRTGTTSSPSSITLVADSA